MCLAINVCVLAAIFLSLSPEECGLSCTKPNRYKMADSKIWSPDPWPSASYSYPCLRHFRLREVTRKVTNKHINVWLFCIRFLQIVSMQILVQFSCVITRKMSCSARLFQLHYAADFSLYVFLVPFPRSTFWRLGCSSSNFTCGRCHVAWTFIKAKVNDVRSRYKLYHKLISTNYGRHAR